MFREEENIPPLSFPCTFPAARKTSALLSEMLLIRFLAFSKWRKYEITSLEIAKVGVRVGGGVPNLKWEFVVAKCNARATEGWNTRTDRNFHKFKPDIFNCSRF
jgi:hypothetical protein